MVLGAWWPVGALPFVEQLGDGVRAHPGVALEHAGRFRRRRHPEHGAPCSWRSATAAASMRVLPAPAGPTTRTRRSSPATEAAASACSTSSPSPFDRRGRGRWFGLGVDRPGDDVFLLGEHGFGGEAWRGRFDPQRAAIRRPSPCRRRAGRDRHSVRAPGRRPARRCRASGVPTSATRDAARHRSPAARRAVPTTSAAPTPPPRPRQPSTARVGSGLRAAASISATSWSTVQPASAASRCHRVARSAAPWPDLRPRVSADASRVIAARSRG